MGITTGLNLAGLKSLLVCICVLSVSVNVIMFIHVYFLDGMINIVHYSSAVCVKLGRRIATFGVFVINEQSNIVIR